ncbi:YodC family protein [Paraburkholderia sp. D1E]|uniref:YodC family protein n=1 Tax=Paraburkholderia sp. D1E TaxID=3461398 RepID=UPI0040457A30
MAGFSKGDVVQVKSGGPAMTVSNVGDYSGMGTGPQDGVLCIWFDGKKKVEDVFDAATLEKIDE